ncbi:MAG: YraN family protein [Burkholderiaceae bacterium]
MPATTKQRRGAAGEDQALAAMQAAGLVLIERNSASRLGEIDLIMQDQQTIVFVEVRVRSSMAFGGAAASVTPAKQRRVQRHAQAWLKKSFGDSPWPACRFDVFALEAGQENWIRNAF